MAQLWIAMRKRPKLGNKALSELTNEQTDIDRLRDGRGAAGADWPEGPSGRQSHGRAQAAAAPRAGHTHAG